MESIMQVIKNRKSCRKYINDTISNNIIEALLSAGFLAPSGKNRKPWRFAVIHDKAVIKQLSKLTTYSRFIITAPVIILIYMQGSDDYQKEKDILSIGACMQNILLSATEMGLGSCVIGEFFGKENKVREILTEDLEGLELICGISIGYPAENKSPSPKLSLDESLIFQKI